MPDVIGIKHFRKGLEIFKKKIIRGQPGHCHGQCGRGFIREHKA